MSLANINPTVSIAHTGSGDIVGEKLVTVYQGIAPTALRNLIALIMTDLREKKNDNAKMRLDTIRATGMLDIDSIAVLDMLSIHLNIIEDSNINTTYTQLTQFMEHSSDSLSLDLCLAALIRLDIKKEKFDIARERYKNSFVKKSYSNEVFFEHIANASELNSAFQERKLEMQENELNGLIRGTFRLNEYDLSHIYSTRLCEVSPSINSSVLFLFSKALKFLNVVVQHHSYWTITASLKHQLDTLINETVTLIDVSNGSDSRLFFVATPLLEFVYGQHEQLRKVCWKYIDEIEKVSNDVAFILKNQYLREPTQHSTIIHEYEKYILDDELKNSKLNELLTLQEIAVGTVDFLKTFGSKYQLSQWILSGGKIVEASELETDFLYLDFSFFSLDDEHRDKLNRIFYKFIQDHKDEIYKLNVLRLLSLGETLYSKKFYSLVCNLFQNVIPTTDLWISPIVSIYLNSLLLSHQFLTLSTILTNINTNELNSFFWQMKARVLEYEGNIEDAIKALDYALELENNSLESWHYLVYLFQKKADFKSDLTSVLSRIPDQVLYTRSNFALNLLLEIAKNEDYNRAEGFIVSWFLEDPVGSAVMVSDFSLKLIIQNSEKIHPDIENFDGCYGGVVYKRENKNITVLFVDEDRVNHQCFLSVKSPLAEFISTMTLGEIKNFGMQEIELLERLPTSVAVFRIASELRDLQNDGTDLFYMLHIPNEPKELFEFLESKLLSIPSANHNHIFDLPNIPLYIKGHLAHPDDSIHGALEQFYREKKSHFNLTNFGIDIFDEVILDVYSVIYFAITGLGYGIDRIPVKFLITYETKTILTNWLTNKKDIQYLSIGADPMGGVFKQTNEDFKEITNAIEYILLNTEIMSPLVVDLPSEVQNIYEYLDSSVFSSIKLSLSNNIPWLCLDELMATMCSSTKCKLLNANIFFINLAKHVKFDTKKSGLYLHALGLIPYSLIYKDFFSMSLSKDYNSFYFLAMMINKYPNLFSDTQHAIQFFVKIILQVFTNKYTIHNNNSFYKEKVFFACCKYIIQPNDGHTAEEKLAMFFYELYSNTLEIPILNKEIEFLTNEFVIGHFLDVKIINNKMIEIQSSAN